MYGLGTGLRFGLPPCVTWDQGRSGDCPEDSSAEVHPRSSGPQASPCSGAPSYNGPCTKGKAVKWGSPTTRPSNWRRSSRLRNTSPRLRGSVWLRCCSSVRDRSAHGVPQPQLVFRAEETTVRCALLLPNCRTDSRHIPSPFSAPPQVSRDLEPVCKLAFFSVGQNLVSESTR